MISTIFNNLNSSSNDFKWILNREEDEGAAFEIGDCWNLNK